MSEQKNVLDDTELEEAGLEESNDQYLSKDESITWGPKLFYGVFIAVLVFFWWFTIYSHGVTPTH